MIEHISFRNVKALRHVEIDLSPLTVIIGPNASGKSSILEGIYGLCAEMHRTAEPASTSALNPNLIYTREGQGDFVIAGHSRQGLVRYRATPPANYAPFALRKSASRAAQEGWGIVVERHVQRETWRSLTDQDRAALSADFSSHLFRLIPSRLSEPSFSEREVPQLAINGEGLASSLAYIALNQPDRFQAISLQLRQIVPSVKRLRFDKLLLPKTEQEFITVDGTQVPRSVTRNIVNDLIVFDFTNGAEIPSMMASEGTLVALGLVTALQSPLRPRTILIDDLEHGLHPKAQREVVRVLKDFLREDDELQIIATTHSPFILDELAPHEVLLTSNDDAAGTVCAHLNEHPDFERWKEEMTPGEFWTVVGEQWLKPVVVAEQPQ